MLPNRASVAPTWHIGGMDTYEISPYGAGWFQVTVIAPSGNSRIRRGFVSELAAQKWVDKSRKNEAKRENIVSATKAP